jgi:carboxyl-terminal processing protease
MTLTKEHRDTILKKIETTVSEKYYSPAFDQSVWQAIVQRHRDSIVNAGSTTAFESAIQKMLIDLSPKGLGLLSDHTPITPRNAINASFAVETFKRERCWVFQDVLPGGVADAAGVRSGDVLLSLSTEPVRPPAAPAAEPPFEMQHSVPITIARSSSGIEHSFVLKTGAPRYKDNPYSEPTAITVGSQPGGISYLRVSLFPGKIGIDFANEVDAVFRGKFASADRLIIDLRGNPGGGIGGLALMSYLTPDRLPVGYSQDRKMIREGKHPSSLPIFDKVPRSKLAIPGLALKFGTKTSVFLYTEALGRRAHHGRTVILVNEHTTGAAEMLAQFAQENRLAVIVGSKTPGRLISRSASKLGFGYRLVVPVAAYVSAKGTQIEGNGIAPNIEVPWSFAEAIEGRDNQLAAAAQALNGTH